MYNYKKIPNNETMLLVLVQEIQQSVIANNWPSSPIDATEVTRCQSYNHAEETVLYNT